MCARACLCVSVNVSFHTCVRALVAVWHTLCSQRYQFWLHFILAMCGGQVMDGSGADVPVCGTVMTANPVPRPALELFLL